MPADLRRTYSTRSSSAKTFLPSSPTSELTSPPPAKRKRPFTDRPTEQNTPSKKPRRALKSEGKAAKAGDKGKSKQPKLTQLHFTLDTPVLRTCPLCDLSYTRGAPDDESLHKAHCARVQRGLDWGKDEAREEANGAVEELESNIKLRDGSRGRIICFRPDIGGKIGTKVRPRPAQPSHIERLCPNVFACSSRSCSRRSASRSPLLHFPKLCFRSLRSTYSSVLRRAPCRGERRSLAASSRSASLPPWPSRVRPKSPRPSSLHRLPHPPLSQTRLRTPRPPSRLLRRQCQTNPRWHSSRWTTRRTSTCIPRCCRQAWASRGCSSHPSTVALGSRRACSRPLRRRSFTGAR